MSTGLKVVPAAAWNPVEVESCDERQAGAAPPLRLPALPWCLKPPKMA
jgi:hypothetical protein